MKLPFHKWKLHTILYLSLIHIYGKAQSAPVSVTRVNGGQEYIVNDGLKEGDVIVAEGVGLLREGTPLSLIHISNLIDSELSVEELGSKMGLSRVQLYRKIKALTNLSLIHICGRVAMTNLVFPNEPYNSLRFYSKGGEMKISNFTIYKLGL